MERLQKYIASSGVTSRRKAEELIVNGKVEVNGIVITELGTKVDSSDIVKVNGEILKQNDNYEYYLLNKPREVISSVSDNLNRTTVVDLIDTEARIYPIGRLDYDTTGLILLTNDGNLANKLMHPSNKVVKTYIAKIKGHLSPSEFYSLKKGIVIEGRKVTPEFVKVRKVLEDNDIVEIKIIEGRNHIVRKIFDALNHEVIKLKRESYAFLDLGNLQSGEYRSLTIKEVKKLYNL